MSRAYRIKVRESARQVIRASDHVGTQLELLEILPPERMADLLARELCQARFPEGGRDPDSPAEGGSGHRSGREGRHGRRAPPRKRSRSFSKQNARTGPPLHKASSKRMTGKICPKRCTRTCSPDGGEYRPTAEKSHESTQRSWRRFAGSSTRRSMAAGLPALKEKAAQIGLIKEVSEDPGPVRCRCPGGINRRARHIATLHSPRK